MAFGLLSATVCGSLSCIRCGTHEGGDSSDRRWQHLFVRSQNKHRRHGEHNLISYSTRYHQITSRWVARTSRRIVAHVAKDRRWELEVSALVTWLDHGPKPCVDRHVYMLVLLHQATKTRYLCGLPSKRSSTVADSVIEMEVFTRWSRRWHSDRGTECAGVFDVLLRNFCTVRTNNWRV